MVITSTAAHFVTTLSSGHNDDNTSVDISIDNAFILTAGKDKKCIIWKRETCEKLKELPCDHNDGITKAIISPNLKYVVTTSYDFTANVYDFVNGNRIYKLKGCDSEMTSAVITPDSRDLLTGHFNGCVSVWNLISGQLQKCIKCHEPFGIPSITCSSNSKYFLTGSWDQTCKVLTLHNGDILSVKRGHAGVVRDVDISNDCKYIVTASLDKTCKVWNFDEDDEIHSLQGHTGELFASKISNINYQVITASLDGYVKVWTLETGILLRSIKAHQLGGVLSLTVSKDCNFIVTGSSDKTAKVWNFCYSMKQLVLVGHKQPVPSAVLSPNGKYIVSGSVDKSIRVWDRYSGKILIDVNNHHKKVVRAVAVSPNNSYFVSGSWDNTSKVFDLKTGQLIKSLEGHKNVIRAVAVSFDNNFILTGSADNTCMIWDLKSADIVHCLRAHKAEVTSVAISKRSNSLVVTGYLPLSCSVSYHDYT